MAPLQPAGPPPGPGASKAAWRRWARARRATLDWRAIGVPVRRHLAEWLATVPPAAVVGYHALGDEVSVDGLAYHLRGRHRWALTRLGDGPDLSVHLAGGPLERHGHGFLQPLATAPLVAPGQVGVVLVPGLAFGPDGSRLGRGGGHYDRLLVRLRPGTYIVGVTPGALVVTGLPREAHDVCMTAVATEGGVRPVSSAAR